MAEEDQAKELDLESGDQAASEEQAKASPVKKLIPIVAAALLSGAAVAGYFVFFGGGGEPELAAEEQEEEPELPAEQAQYLALDPPFVINVPDRGRQRFLQASVTVMSRDPSALLSVEEHMPVIRHNITNVLSAQTIASIQTPGGIEQVRAAATDQINKLLIEEYGSEAIEEVLFTAFVMQ
jgi:flagellar FliL protein